ncbi:MAG: glycosyltransferase family 2 protein [Bacteroides sp.]|nr:glycosyltransferase family 2 protein [Bacteroides sp.]
MEPFISIVVPVYNVENYIKECIESLLNQSYDNYEIILVDDGSKDDSGAICDQYTDFDRIRVYHQPNKGVTEARKFGVEKSQGQYITFVDSDDTLRDTALSYLVSGLEDENTSMVISSISKAPFTSTPAKIDVDEAIMDFVAGGLKFDTGPCGKLYRRSLFGNDVFNIPREITKGEDMLMNVRLLFGCNASDAIKFMPGRIYNYRIRSGSVTTKRKFDVEYESKFYDVMRSSIPAERVQSLEPYIYSSAFRSFANNTFRYTQLPEYIQNSKLYSDLRNAIGKRDTGNLYIEKKLIKRTSGMSRQFWRIAWLLKYGPDRVVKRLRRKLHSAN